MEVKVTTLRCDRCGRPAVDSIPFTLGKQKRKMDLCAKDLSDLKKHSYTVGKAAPRATSSGGTFKCDDCGRPFPTKQGLSMHLSLAKKRGSHDPAPRSTVSLAGGEADVVVGEPVRSRA